ncbi:translation initiation factor IF-3 [Thiovulum sp. ES]|nr:translation initiation factor IF-3 [Thiovulum sp. ES]
MSRRHGNHNRRPKQEDLPPMNENIRFPEVRCVGDDGTQHGIIPTSSALSLAQDQGLDLVLIADNAEPPVAKIMDYGKFKYQAEKKKKEAKKNQKTITVKEIKLSVKIAENDINFKVKQATDFLAKEYYVKFRVFLKGREMGNPEAGKDVLFRVWEMVKDHGVMEKEPFFEGRYYNMMVLPNKK